MSAVLKRLEEVRESMKELTRDLRAPRRYFDAGEVNRKVTERVERVEVAPSSKRAEPATSQ